AAAPAVCGADWARAGEAPTPTPRSAAARVKMMGRERRNAVLIRIRRLGLPGGGGRKKAHGILHGPCTYGRSRNDTKRRPPLLGAGGVCPARAIGGAYRSCVRPPNPLGLAPTQLEIVDDLRLHPDRCSIGFGPRTKLEALYDF